MSIEDEHLLLATSDGVVVIEDGCLYVRSDDGRATEPMMLTETDEILVTAGQRVAQGALLAWLDLKNMNLPL